MSAIRESRVLFYAELGARCTLLPFFGVMPAAHIDSQTVRLTRSPRAWLVMMQRCGIREDGVDNGPKPLPPHLPARTAWHLPEDEELGELRVASLKTVSQSCTKYRFRQQILPRPAQR